MPFTWPQRAWSPPTVLVPKSVAGAQGSASGRFGSGILWQAPVFWPGSTRESVSRNVFPMGCQDKGGICKECGLGLFSQWFPEHLMKSQVHGLPGLSWAHPTCCSQVEQETWSWTSGQLGPGPL